MQMITDQSFEGTWIDDIQVISGVRPLGRTVDYRTKRRQNHGLLYICEGQATFWSGQSAFSAQAGQLVFIPMYSRYRMQYTAPSTSFVLVNFKLFDKIGGERTLSDRIEIIVENDFDNRFAGIIRGFEQTAATQGFASFVRKKELLYRLLGAIYDVCSLPSMMEKTYSQIHAGVLLLERTYRENIPVDAFAKASCISVSRFRSLFHQQYGMSPVQYRNRLRVRFATAMLSEGGCTVSEVAHACGFQNVGYFCRYYKKLTGKTPSGAKPSDLS